MKDWVAWHGAYDDPASSLARRLELVRLRLGEALDALAGAERRLLSLCAGDGRDVIPVLAARSMPSLTSALLVERDEELSRRSSRAAMAAGLTGVHVRCDDAGQLASFGDVLPVDVLLLCGIFGNIDHAQVKDVIEVVPQLLAPDGYVIWTRGASEPDHRSEVRSWFLGAGLAEIAFDGAPEVFGVGVNQRGAERPGPRDEFPARLFRFANE